MYADLFTPLRTPASPEEERYSRAQSRTRTIVEQTFDVMVRRFLYLARKLQFQDLDVIWAIACAVLHSLCIKWTEEAEEVGKAAEVDSSDEDEAPETSRSTSSFRLIRQIF